jgi:hypothetical protein
MVLSHFFALYFTALLASKIDAVIVVSAMCIYADFLYQIPFMLAKL